MKKKKKKKKKVFHTSSFQYNLINDIKFSSQFCKRSFIEIVKRYAKVAYWQMTLYKQRCFFADMFQHEKKNPKWCGRKKLCKCMCLVKEDKSWLQGQMVQEESESPNIRVRVQFEVRVWGGG